MSRVLSHVPRLPGQPPARPGTVPAARQVFGEVDPSGALAASWLTARVAPTGWLWQDLDAHVRLDGGFAVVSALARLDAARYVTRGLPETA